MDLLLTLRMLFLSISLIYSTSLLANAERFTEAKMVFQDAVTDQSMLKNEFQDKRIKLTGIVAYKGPDIFGLPSIEITDKFGQPSLFLCVLPLSKYPSLIDVSIGQRINMSGVFRRVTEKRITMKQCKIY
ncbi:hypothetical protein L1D51_21485, partial [Pseudoalteromonas shioyasakiensis]|uniref:hypothetical protein n=1 Tax=Pseudoalteromonas shioyasakiensis TaxID=1190813 RepID=UPI001EFE6DAC